MGPVRPSSHQDDVLPPPSYGLTDHHQVPPQFSFPCFQWLMICLGRLSAASGLETVQMLETKHAKEIFWNSLLAASRRFFTVQQSSQGLPSYRYSTSLSAMGDDLADEWEADGLDSATEDEMALAATSSELSTPQPSKMSCVNSEAGGGASTLTWSRILRATAQLLTLCFRYYFADSPGNIPSAPK